MKDIEINVLGIRQFQVKNLIGYITPKEKRSFTCKPRCTITNVKLQNYLPYLAVQYDKPCDFYCLKYSTVIPITNNLLHSVFWILQKIGDCVVMLAITRMYPRPVFYHLLPNQLRLYRKLIVTFLISF